MPAAPRAKSVFWSLIGVFAVIVVATSIFSWWVVGGVRATAASTDARLRELAWAVLAYADRHDGFPTSEAELRAFAATPANMPETLAKQPLAVDGRRYPMTRAEAGAPAAFVPLDQVFATIEVEWPVERDVQPILRPRGLPTMQGTGPAVGDWLFAMAERVRAR
jgi:hypothetical protein